MYIKKQEKEEIYAMYLNGIPVEDIAEIKEIKATNVEKAIAEWESILLKELNPQIVRRAFLHSLKSNSVAKAVCDAEEKTGQARDVVEEILGFRYPEVTVKVEEDRELIYKWNGLYTFCQCIKRRKSEEARRYYAICKADNA